MTLRDFWPLPGAVTTCAPLGAEELSDAALLAVHRSLPLFRANEPTNEHAVLGALLASDAPVVIVGPSGAGKTHLLRWLALQLDPARYVGRALRGANLPDVLECVLTDLEGAAFDGLRAPPTAPEELGAITVEELLEQFRTALQRRATEARAQCDDAVKRNEKVDPQLRAIAEIHGPGLVALLSGPTKDVLLRDTSERPSVFGALANREGAEFDPADFEFPTVPTNKLTDRTLQRYVQKLKTNTQNERATAAALLNDVRDEIAEQPRTASAPQPAELFRRVRVALRKEEKELVLLFDEAEPDAVRELVAQIATETEGESLCAVRVVIATAEFPSGADRAFVFSAQPTDEVETLTDLIGAYLNAARDGAEAPDALAAFGESRSGHNLFPFNRSAIRQLAAQHLDTGSQLNPRELIEGVLRKTLLPYRDTFVRGAFPPEGFHEFDPDSLGAEVLLWLKRERPDDYARYAVLLEYWADRPQRPEDITLAAEVYDVFGLAPLSAFAAEPTPVPVVEPEAVAEVPRAEPVTRGWANELSALVARSQLFADRAVPALDLAPLREALSAAWIGWVRAQVPQIGDAELVPFEADPDYRELVEQIRTWVNELRQAEQKPGASSADFAAVEEVAAQLRAALGKLPTDAPAEVKAFLAVANSSAGAPMSALTPAVLEWLMANNRSEKYRVRR